MDSPIPSSASVAKLLGWIDIDSLTRESSFSKRACRKTSPENWLRALIATSEMGKVTFSADAFSLPRWSANATNANEKDLPAFQIESIYGQRWAIKVLLKSWKSGLNLSGIHFRAKLFDGQVPGIGQLDTVEPGAGRDPSAAGVRKSRDRQPLQTRIADVDHTGPLRKDSLRQSSNLRKPKEALLLRKTKGTQLKGNT